MFINHCKRQKGFSLIELIAVMVIVSIISATAIVRLMPSSLFELQSARDQVVAALFHAQQKALFTPYDIRVTLLGGVVDVRMDENADGLFPSSESIRVGAVQYPLTLVSSVQVSTHTLDYDSLGETTAANISVSKSSKSVSIAVSASGFAQ
ncbi:pilus assembly FimT family protein [Marinagarivorans cellulosilyticus]|uniref:MSHA pilin protein MshC n=1 Tax=Marinagarivorans cellulosilyticus TaxID=2721545 RepID=A0AAN1WII9_9GAMM|nr:type II secretion system protein [Marinagarivorans cellulosilyticus]BCD98245.1 MSHA pilin protein MshC [Marinagarivorans cellulosilyticus]